MRAEEEYIDCPLCGGSGQSDCSTCDGNGWVDDPSDGGTMTCPECDGEHCPDCGGEGLVENEDYAHSS